MTFMPNHAARPHNALGRLAPAFSRFIDRLIAADLEAVRKISNSSRSEFGRACAIAISKLGNGWIYPILATIVFTAWGLAGYRIILLAAANAALMHCLYPIIKRRFRRLRPFKVDPALSSLLDTLDEHSFPSGHAMTLTGVLAPIVMLWPAMAIWAVVMACCMAWSRVATAHHYPTDVVAGALLGVGVGYPISVSIVTYL